MKSLRVYFVMSMIWAAAGLALVACSEKGSNNGGIQCPIGMIQINGFCSYDGSNGGSGGTNPGGSYGFNPNGSIHNTDSFRDFNYRLYNYKYFCDSYPYSCSDVQVRIQAINSTEYYIYLTSPSLGTGGGGGSVVLRGTKFQYTGQSQVIFEVYYGNPTQYIIAELVVQSGLDSASSNYSFNYKTNAGTNTGIQIVSGTMRKGIDY